MSWGYRENLNHVFPRHGLHIRFWNTWRRLQGHSSFREIKAVIVRNPWLTAAL